MHHPPAILPRLIGLLWPKAAAYVHVPGNCSAPAR